MYLRRHGCISRRTAVLLSSCGRRRLSRGRHAEAVQAGSGCTSTSTAGATLGRMVRAATANNCCRCRYLLTVDLVGVVQVAFVRLSRRPRSLPGRADGLHRCDPRRSLQCFCTPLRGIAVPGSNTGRVFGRCQSILQLCNLLWGPWCRPKSQRGLIQTKGDISSSDSEPRCCKGSNGVGLT